MSNRFILLLYILFSQIVFGQKTNEIMLSKDNLGMSFGQNIGVFEDLEKQYETYSDLFELPKNAFTTGTEDILDFNFTASRYWLKFSLTNKSEFTHFILEAARPVTNKVELFEIVDDLVINHYKSGDDFHYDTKKIVHRKNIFPIELEYNQKKTYYLKLESDGELLFTPVIVKNRIAFFSQDFKDQFKNGFYYGLIALVVIIYFFFFIFLRDKTFLFYILYAFSQGILQFSLDGYSHHHFFPSGGYFANHILLVFAGLTVVFLLTYVNNFLHLKENSKTLWKTFTITRFIVGLILLVSLIPGLPYEFSFPIINGASLFSVLLAAYSILRIRAKGVKVDLFFSIAFIILIIGGVVFILGNVGVVGDKMISMGALKISSALEFIVLSISMSNKYGKLQLEKEEAQKSALISLKEKNTLMDEINLKLEYQVKERTTEIEAQKEELAKNNKEIVSSIKYAERIQRAILPSAEHITNLLPKSFVFYRPKDVVSGDFYFIESTHTSTTKNENRHTLFTAVDCTGHGVPGAFMSIVGNNLLTQSLTEEAINSPAEALNFLNKGVNKTLRRTIEGKVIRDGMDIAMCALNHNNSKLVFSGAKNPLYLIRNKTDFKQNNIETTLQIIAETDQAVLLSIKGDKHPIGNTYDGELKTFTDHEIDLIKGDQIFVFTDGYADQFGGERGKKYNYRRFRELLLSLYQAPIQEQEQMLLDEFKTWLGNEEQIDDILVMSVKI